MEDGNYVGRMKSRGRVRDNANTNRGGYKAKEKAQEDTVHILPPRDDIKITATFTDLITTDHNYSFPKSTALVWGNGYSHFPPTASGRKVRKNGNLPNANVAAGSMQFYWTRSIRQSIGPLRMEVTLS